MRYLNCLIASLWFGAVSQALAAEPPEAPPAESSASATTPSEPASPAATQTADLTDAAKAAAAASADAARAAKEKELEAQTKRMRSQGYKPVTRSDGTLVYCRKEPKLGTHFEQQVCGTAEQLDQSARDARELTERIQRSYVETNKN